MRSYSLANFFAELEDSRRRNGKEASSQHRNILSEQKGRLEINTFRTFFTPKLSVKSVYEADTKTLSCRCRLFLLFGQDLRSPIGQQWYQVIGKQKKSIGMSGRQEHDQERVLVSASYLCMG